MTTGMNQWISSDLRARGVAVRRFLDNHVLPVEAAIEAEDRLGDHTTLQGLRIKAKAEGLWTPHLPAAWGGADLGTLGMCVLFREMGRSPVGPTVFGCDAPDQGNMDLLLRVGSPAQRERWLRPLAAGSITSAFCMTEPAPGAGSDPRNLATTAREDGDGWRLDGHKWYSTGAGKASFLLVMARTSEDPRHGATIFLVPRDREGVIHVRDFDTMAEPLLAHREAELRFEGVRLDERDVLGGIGEGFSLAQLRLVPARLTHCMRWLGLASRTLALCEDYIRRRISFGRPLADHQLVQAMIAEAATTIHAGNLMTLHCAAQLENGDVHAARTASSITKTFVARGLCKILDDAIQMHGGLGYSDDMPFARWYRFARAARIADGPDEVHIGTIARDVLSGRFDPMA